MSAGKAVDQRVEEAARAAEIERPPHVVAVVGEPPVDPVGREQWRRAAGEIESYTARWGTPPTAETVPVEPTQQAHLDRVADRVATAAPADVVVPASSDGGGIGLT